MADPHIKSELKTDLFRARALRLVPTRQPHCHGTADTQAAPGRWRPDSSDGEYYSQRAWLDSSSPREPMCRRRAEAMHSPQVFSRASRCRGGGRSLLLCTPKRSDLSPALARGAHVASLVAARRALPVAPSAIRPEATSFTSAGFKPCVTPRALATSEIPAIVEQYRQAAHNALLAQFDGVEIHAAMAICSSSFCVIAPTRERCYGGSRENRARLLLEVARPWSRSARRESWHTAVPSEPGQWRGPRQRSAEPTAMWSNGSMRSGWLTSMSSKGPLRDRARFQAGLICRFLRRAFNASIWPTTATTWILALQARQRNLAESHCFRAAVHRQPRSRERLRSSAPLNVPERETFFGGGARGYTITPRSRSDP